METLEKGVNNVQSYQWKHQNYINDVRPGIFIVNFKYISHIFLVFFLLTFIQLNVSWDLDRHETFKWGSQLATYALRKLVHLAHSTIPELRSFRTG